MELFIASASGLVTLYCVYAFHTKHMAAEYMRTRVHNMNMSGSFRMPFRAAVNDGGAMDSKNCASLDEIFENEPHLKYLYYAGIRRRKHIHLARLIRKYFFLLPLFLFFVFSLDQGLQPIDLVNAVFATGLILSCLFLWVHWKRKQRNRAIVKMLPQVLDLLIVGVEAGLSFISVLERVIKESDSKNPLIQELATLQYEYLSGLSLHEAMSRTSDRCNLNALRMCLGGIIESETLGASMGQALRTQAEELRHQYRERMRERALQIPIKILFPIALIFLSVVLTMLGPTVFRFMNLIGNTGFSVPA
jgi:Flp pilus assembly protein TadB